MYRAEGKRVTGREGCVFQTRSRKQRQGRRREQHVFQGKSIRNKVRREGGRDLYFKLDI